MWTKANAAWLCFRGIYSSPEKVSTSQKTLHRKVWHGPRFAGQTFRAEQQFYAGKIEGVFSGKYLPKQPFMLPKHQKLSRTSFPHYKDRKFSWTGKALRIYAYRSDKSGFPPRFAVVVPQHSSTGAVGRNRFKRQVMMMLGESMARFAKLPYCKYVIFPKEHLRTLVRGDIKKDMQVFSGE